MEWIDVLIDVPETKRVATASFWSAALGWPIGPPESGAPEFASFEPPAGTAYVHLQVLAAAEDEPGLHLDFPVVDVAAETARLTALGATALPDSHPWQRLRSPGGLTFCLLPPEPGRAFERPAAVDQPNGVRSRLMQICIDSPQDRHEVEVAFWAAATGWTHQPSDLPEFSGKLVGPPASPVRLLFQRLSADAPERQTRAHIDLGADDVEAEAIRLEALGARPLASRRDWIPLRDPAGLAFCITGNDPS